MAIKGLIRAKLSMQHVNGLFSCVGPNRSYLSRFASLKNGHEHEFLRWFLSSTLPNDLAIMSSLCLQCARPLEPSMRPFESKLICILVEHVRRRSLVLRFMQMDSAIGQVQLLPVSILDVLLSCTRRSQLIAPSIESHDPQIIRRRRLFRVNP